jgi:hypothetical protein
MRKSQLFDAIRTEIRRHDLSHFQNEKDRIVQPGFPTWRKVFYILLPVHLDAGHSTWYYITE